MRFLRPLQRFRSYPIINQRAPINRDLVVWLLAHPAFMHGTTWTNLNQRANAGSGSTGFHNGVLTNFAAPFTTASGFNRTPRRNGWSHLAFDNSGTADFVNLGDVFSGTASVASQGDFTILMWVNVVTNLNNFGTFLGQGNSNHDFDFLLNTGGALSFYINAGGHHIDTTTTLTAGTWYYVGYTYAETGTLGSQFNALTSYVNGKAEASGGDAAWRNTSAINCYLGGTPSYTRPTSILMDDVRLYKRCLRPQEVMFLYRESDFRYQHVFQPRGNPYGWTLPLIAPSFDPVNMPAIFSATQSGGYVGTRYV